GYRMLLHQVGPGNFTGVFTQKVKMSSGAELKVDAASAYTYNGLNIFPSDEFSILDLSPVAFTGGNIHFTGSGYYISGNVVPSVGLTGLVILAAGLLLLGWWRLY